MERHPIEIDAFVLLPRPPPHHLGRCPTTTTTSQPDGGKSNRTSPVTAKPHLNVPLQHRAKPKNERAFWQRRFWEHTVKDTQDYINHVEIHPLQSRSSTAWLPPQRTGNTPASTATSKPAYTTQTGAQAQESPSTPTSATNNSLWFSLVYVLKIWHNIPRIMLIVLR